MSLVFYIGLIFMAGVGVILFSLCNMASKASEPAEFLGEDLSMTKEFHGGAHARLSAIINAALGKKAVT